MVHVLLAGESRDLIEVAELLTQQGHHVTLVPRTGLEAEGALGAGHAALLAVPAAARGRDVVLSSVDRAPAIGRESLREARPFGMMQRYETGDRLYVSPGSVLRVVQGMVILSAMHADGAHVVIGMLGPNDFLLPHSDDGCHVEAIAQTDLETEVFSWSDLAGHEFLASAMALRVLRSEAWAAAQAHPYTEQRLLSILRLLAEQFGEDQAGGRLLPVRITQGQLAAMTGATRPTVSRVLTVLKRQGSIALVGTGNEQRMWILDGA